MSNFLPLLLFEAYIFRNGVNVTGVKGLIYDYSILGTWKKILIQT